MIFIMYLLAPSLQEERKRSRPAPNCDGALDVRSFELVGEWPLERPQNYLYRMNTHVHTTLIWMISSLKIFWLREIGSPDISTPKIFVKIHRRQRLRTTSKRPQKVQKNPSRSFAAHCPQFCTNMFLFALLQRWEQCPVLVLQTDWPYNERQVHD